MMQLKLVKRKERLLQKQLHRRKRKAKKMQKMQMMRKKKKKLKQILKQILI